MYLDKKRLKIIAVSSSLQYSKRDINIVTAKIVMPYLRMGTAWTEEEAIIEVLNLISTDNKVIYTNIF